MTLTYAPVTTAPPVVTPPAPINDTSQTAADRQLQVAGEGASLRVVLGEDCLGAQVGPVWYHNGLLVARCIWAMGPAEGVQSVFLNDQPLPADVQATHYTGIYEQGIDPVLAAAGAAQSPPVAYTDTLPGIAYSVFVLPAPALTAPPVFKAIFKGMKLYDPRTGLTAWTDNAGLALRAFLNAPWGENKAITGGDVALADRCDELCGTAPDQEKRCRIGLTLDARQPAGQWRETLRTYAECFVVPDGDGYLLIPDAPAASEYTYSHEAGNLLELGGLKRAASGNLPTVMTVWYTDRSVTPWRDIAIDPVKRPGVDAGTTPWRPQEIRLNGIFSAGQAQRVAVTRLNKLWLCDLSGEIYTLDDGMQVRPGTVVTLIDPRIGAGKQVRVFGSSGVNGQYVQTFVEHDNAAYSDEVIADPSSPDTTLPLPTDPQPPTALTAAETAFKPAGGGAWKPRLVLSWTAPLDPYLADYLPEYLAPGAAAWTMLPAITSTQVNIDDLEVGAYGLRAAMRNSVGLTSPVSAVLSFTVTGAAAAAENEAEAAAAALAAAEAAAAAAAALAAANALAAAGQADVTLDNLGNARIEFDTTADPQILAYEMRVGANFDAGVFVATTTGNSFTLPVLGSAGNTYWIRAKYAVGYSIAGFRIDFTGTNMPAPGLPTWSIAEPNLVYTWAAATGATQYLCLFEVGGVTTVKTVATPGVSFPIPKYAATIRIVAMAADGTLSPFVDEDISIAGQYRYNEIVNVALPLTTGQYLNLAFTAANTVKRASLLGNAPVAPYAQNINDGDLYSFGYNLANLAASSIQNISASWFRQGFWREQAGYFESAVVDLGAVLTGSLILNLTKTVTYIGNAPVSGWAHVSAEYLADADTQALIDQKAFLTARFFVATDSAFSASWKEAANGDWITARYVKIVVEVAMASPLTEITVTAGAITIDVPDVTETGSKTGVTSAGAALVFTKSFHAVSCVIATARGAAKAYTGNITATGCTLYADVGTQQVDYFVKGY